jgi:energy-coupling factor transporter transmembrane protein EcfT
MANLNRILAIFFFVLAGVAVLLGLLGLPSEGFFFALLGGLHLLAVRGFRTHAPWRWIAQAMPVILLLVVILSFLTW